MWRFWPFRRGSRRGGPRIVGDAGIPRRRLFGREYTAGIPYALPSDLGEMNRLDFQHFVLRQAFRGNYAAPLHHPTDILDVGSGTGRWAKEMASTFPAARVSGLDIKEPVTDENGASSSVSDPHPVNYTFVAGNILKGLPFPDATFDFTHQRLLFFAIPTDRWPFVLSELSRVTRPGGWVEVVEGHYGYDPMGPAAQQIADAMLAAMLRRGIDPRSSAHLEQLVSNAGLQQVQLQTVKLPVGDWGGRLGKLVATDVLSFSQAAKPLLLAQGMTESDFARLITTMRHEMETLRYTWPFYIVYGQRPG